MANPLPSIRRPAVSAPASRLAGPLASAVSMESYRLAGGTALAWYLGHRLSDDLDFFSRELIGLGDPDGGITERARLSAALRTLDPTATIDTSKPNTVLASVLGCRVSFMAISGNWLAEPTQVAEGFGLAVPEEIAAMKLLAVTTRTAKKDFYDLRALVDSGFTIEQMVSAWQKMYPADIDMEAAQHLAKSLKYFEDAETDPDPVTFRDDLTWEGSKKTARDLSRGLDRLIGLRFNPGRKPSTQ